MSASSTIGDEENKNLKGVLKDIEKTKECRNDEENGKKEQGKERKGDDEKVLQASS